MKLIKKVGLGIGISAHIIGMIGAVQIKVNIIDPRSAKELNLYKHVFMIDIHYKDTSKDIAEKIVAHNAELGDPFNIPTHEYIGDIITDTGVNIRNKPNACIGLFYNLRPTSSWRAYLIPLKEKKYGINEY